MDGLKQALVADVKERLAAAVKDGKLTEAQAASMLERYTERVEELVTGTLRWGGVTSWLRVAVRDVRGAGQVAPGSYGSFVPAQWRSGLICPANTSSPRLCPPEDGARIAGPVASRGSARRGRSSQEDFGLCVFAIRRSASFP